MNLETNITSEVTDTGGAVRAAGLSRTLETRPDQMENFKNAFHYMEKNVKENKRLDAEQLGVYSAITMGVENHRWEKRYSHPRNIDIVDRTLNYFYDDVQEKGQLTLSNLANLYDKLILEEPFLDGNSRARVLALSHILLSYGYSTPVTAGINKDTWAILGNRYKDHEKRSIEFLKLILPESNRPPL